MAVAEEFLDLQMHVPVKLAVGRIAKDEFGLLALAVADGVKRISRLDVNAQRLHRTLPRHRVEPQKAKRALLGRTLVPEVKTVEVVRLVRIQIRRKTRLPPPTAHRSRWFRTGITFSRTRTSPSSASAPYIITTVAAANIITSFFISVFLHPLHFR